MTDSITLTNPTREYLQGPAFEEFLNKNKLFEEALIERCEKGGITLTKLPNVQAQMQGASALYCLEKEVYALYNDGNVANWQYMGNIK